MIRFLADEDFNNDILRSLIRRVPRIDAVRAQDLDLRCQRRRSPRVGGARTTSRADHDVNTLLARAFERVEYGLRHSGVIAVAQSLSVGTVVEDLVLITECLTDDEWKDRVVLLPLR